MKKLFVYGITTVRLILEQIHLVVENWFCFLLKCIFNHLNYGLFLKNIDLQYL